MSNNIEICDWYEDGMCLCGAVEDEEFLAIKEYDEENKIIQKCPHDKIEGQMACVCFQIEG